MVDQHTKNVENIESNSELVADLADEFAERFRRGERPPLSEYVARCPEAATEIREVLSALIQVERLAPSAGNYLVKDALVSDPPKFEQLGDFRIIREVGRGGMGVVYEAEQLSLARQVALKVLPKQVLFDEKYKQRFVREAKAAARLHHTNIVPVFGVGEQDGIQYYVMQFIHGQGLDEILVELKRLREESLAGQTPSPTRQPYEEPVERAPRTSDQSESENAAIAQSVAQSLMSGRFERTVLVSEDEESPHVSPDLQIEHDTATVRFSDTHIVPHSFVLPGHTESSSRAQSRNVYWRSVARIGQQAAEALEYAHEQGIIHRDVKPGNLLLDTGGNVWVADFGLAKTTDQADLTQTGDILGTIRYMAPEQFEGVADHRSDVYSLGLTLYEMLALKPAFDERDRRKLVVQVTKETPSRLRSIDPTIPRDLETIVHKAIERDPTHRYQSAEDLAADLERYQNDEPIRARWISPVTRFSRWCRRNPTVAGLTTTIGALLLVASLVAFMTARKFEKQADTQTKLAHDLNDALGDAQQNLTLAMNEQERAESNLDLALEALDAVYLDAIGEDKLLGQPESRLEGRQLRRSDHGFSELERELIRRGLGFYEQFAGQNERNPQAGAHVAQAYYRVGLLQSGLAEYDLAAESYQKAIAKYEVLIQEEPENADHYAGLSRSIYDFALTKPTWGEAEATMKKALTHVERGLAVDSENAELYLLRAWLSIDIHQQVDKVKSDLETAIKLDPANIEYYIQCGLWLCGGVCLNDHDPDKAINYLTRATTLAPDNAEAFTWLGFAYLNRDRRSQPALKYFNRAIELRPTYLFPRVYRARIYREVFKDYRSAKQETDAIISLDPKFARGYTERALALSKLGDHEAALGDIEKAQRLSPLSFHAAWRKGKIYHAKGDFKKAVEAYTEVNDRSPSFWLVYLERAASYVELGEYDSALQDIDRAAKLSSQPAYVRQIHYRRGNIFKTQKKYSEAIQEYTKAATATPHAPSYAQRASCEAKLGQTQKSLKSLSRAVELRPFNNNYRRQRLEIAWEIGRYDLALQDYLVSVSLDRFSKLGFDPDITDFKRVGQIMDNLLIDKQK